MKEMNASSCAHQAGDIVYFGRFSAACGFEEPLAWKVLEANEDELLLITRDCILWEPYYYCYGSNAEWKKTSLYKILQDIFMGKAFTARESMFLKPFPDGESFTILSRKEIEKYMPETGMRAACTTPFADDQAETYGASFYGRDCCCEDPEDALAKWRSGNACISSWWVRSEEENGEWPAICVSLSGEFIDEDHMAYRGVRPCIRLALRSSWQAETSPNGRIEFKQI